MPTTPERELFPIVDVSSWQETHEEPMGTKAKVWLAAPNGERWLFKQVRGDDERAEDWPEKVVAELAKLTGVPAAAVELAEHRGNRGIISRDVSHGHDLVHGNEVLFGQDPTYEKEVRRPEHGYTLAAVEVALAACLPPSGWSPSNWSAYDVFAGYLVLDALVANQDRHHENWGVLVDRVTGERSLAPSFDHASSLAFMLTDNDRRDRLETGDVGRSVERWVERGKSHFEGRPPLMDLARDALASCNPEASRSWVEHVLRLDPVEWSAILDRIPLTRMSDVARTFAKRVIDLNRGRLLDACGHSGTTGARSA